MPHSHMWSKMWNVSTSVECSSRRADLKSKRSDRQPTMHRLQCPSPTHAPLFLTLLSGINGPVWGHFPEEVRCDDGINFSTVGSAELRGRLLKGSFQLGSELRPSSVPPPSGCDTYRTGTARDGVREEACVRVSRGFRGKAESLMLQSRYLLPLATTSRLPCRKTCTFTLLNLVFTPPWYSKEYVLLLFTPNPRAGLSTQPVCSPQSVSRFLPSACWVVILMFLCFHQQISICQDSWQILPQHLL